METTKDETDWELTTDNLKLLNMGRKENLCCDYTLKSKDGIDIPAHKYVLASASSYFANMFNSGMRESRENFVILEKFNGENLENVINFIYTEGKEINLTEENAKEILDIALYFNLGNLMEICKKYLIEHLTKDNFHDLLEYGMTWIKDDLLKLCCEWILENFYLIRRSENLLKISFESMKFLVKIDKYNRTSHFENILHQIITDWIKYDLETRRKHIKDLIEHIIYENVTREFLISRVMGNKILIDDKFFLLKMLKLARRSIMKQIILNPCNYCKTNGLPFYYSDDKDYDQ